MAAVVVIAVIATLAATRLRGSDGDSASGSVDGGGGPPFTVPTGDASEVAAAKINVEASSFHVPDGDITYNPGNLLDGDLESAWNSDSDVGQASGQLLTFRFSEPVDLKAVRFVNGYAKDDRVYNANDRVRDLLVLTDGSATAQAVTLLDTSDRQEISFDFGFTSKVVLEIVEIYPGDGFENPELTTDLALTEVSFVAVQP